MPLVDVFDIAISFVVLAGRPVASERVVVASILQVWVAKPQVTTDYADQLNPNPEVSGNLSSKH